MLPVVSSFLCGAQDTGAFLRVPALPSASSRHCPPALHREPCSRQRVGRLLLPVCGARPAVGQEGSVPLVRPQSCRLLCWGRGGVEGFLSVPGAAGVCPLSVGVWGWRESPTPPLGAEAFTSTPAIAMACWELEGFLPSQYGTGCLSPPLPEAEDLHPPLGVRAFPANPPAGRDLALDEKKRFEKGTSFWFLPLPPSFSRASSRKGLESECRFCLCPELPNCPTSPHSV